jgi:hypothetical protein
VASALIGLLLLLASVLLLRTTLSPRALAPFAAQPHLITGPYGMRGLDPHPVDPDMPGPAGAPLTCAAAILRARFIAPSRFRL